MTAWREGASLIRRRQLSFNEGGVNVVDGGVDALLDTPPDH